MAGRNPRFHRGGSSCELAGERIHQPGDGDADEDEKREGPKGVPDAAGGGASP